MKKLTAKILVLAVAGLVSLTCLTSCGSFSNMSQDDAYNLGRGIGTAGRVLLDN